MLVMRVHVDDAIERFGRIVCVQRRNGQMPGAGKVERCLHGLAVANLTDQNHIGRFAHRASQRMRIRMRVETHFPLVDNRLSVRM